MHFSVKTLLLAVSLSSLFACKKDDNPGPSSPTNPGNEKEDTEELFDIIQGKWENKTEAVNRITGQAPVIKFIEVLEDSTVTVAYQDGWGIQGKLAIVDSVTIIIEESVTVTNIKVTGNKIEAQVSQQGEETFTLIAEKTAHSTSDKNKLFYQTWKSVDPRYHTFQFTPNGSFIIMLSETSENVLFFNFTWTGDNTFDYSNGAFENGAEVIELTENSLKITFDSSDETIDLVKLGTPLP